MDARNQHLLQLREIALDELRRLRDLRLELDREAMSGDGDLHRAANCPIQFGTNPRKGSPGLNSGRSSLR